MYGSSCSFFLFCSHSLFFSLAVYYIERKSKGARMTQTKSLHELLTVQSNCKIRSFQTRLGNLSNFYKGLQVQCTFTRYNVQCVLLRIHNILPISLPILQPAAHVTFQVPPIGIEKVLGTFREEGRIRQKNSKNYINSQTYIINTVQGLLRSIYKTRDIGPKSDLIFEYLKL